MPSIKLIAHKFKNPGITLRHRLHNHSHFRISNINYLIDCMIAVAKTAITNFIFAVCIRCAHIFNFVFVTNSDGLSILW